MQFLWLSLFLLLLPPFSFANPVRTSHVLAELTMENSSLQPGAVGVADNWIGLRLETEPHWHTYWQFPGDTGLPTKVQWELPAGWSVSEPHWPLPSRIQLPPLVNFGFEGESLLGFQLQLPSSTEVGSYTVKASASWLVCKEECIPEKAELSLRVLVKAAKPEPQPWANLFTQLREIEPKVGLPLEAVARGQELGLRFASKISEQDSPDFFPLEAEIVKGKQLPKLEEVDGVSTLWMETAAPFSASAKSLRGILVLRPQGGQPVVHAVDVPLPKEVVRVSVAPTAVVPEAPGVWLAIVFAFLGGLVLNLMPCVFPVLGIKVMSLVKQSKGHPQRARVQGKVYALGVLFTFWALAGLLLALRSAGEAIGWGFQLQHPGFVTLLILLFSFIAADLAGFVKWEGSWMGAGAKLANRDGFAGSFFTGMLAVVVATPCTAPFMGTAIGVAFGQPAWVVFMVFTALGLGLALPFLLLCYKPGILKVLPKPGAWMERLKEFFAFPMAGTVLWLLWVLTQQIGSDGALRVELGLLLLGSSVWMRNRFSQGALRALSYVLLLCGALVAGSAAMARGEATGTVSHSENWQPYREEALQAALDEGKPVFVDFTAAWCLTCQINKKLVLDRSATQKFFREKGVVLLLADWTNRDPAITKALESHGRIGVPLYVAYASGSREPKLLSQILSEAELRSAFP